MTFSIKRQFYSRLLEWLRTIQPCISKPFDFKCGFESALSQVWNSHSYSQKPKALRWMSVCHSVTSRQLCCNVLRELHSDHCIEWFDSINKCLSNDQFPDCAVWTSMLSWSLNILPSGSFVSMKGEPQALNCCVYRSNLSNQLFDRESICLCYALFNDFDRFKRFIVYEC